MLEVSIYILFGIIMAGLLKIFLSPAYVSRHLGQGRFNSVLKAALLGIPIPLCSCGVLPAAASLKKQGANNGAVTAFLISTPQSGVDSISVTWALLDPIMTVARPVVGFLSAIVAGLSENFLNPPRLQNQIKANISCSVVNCCNGMDRLPEEHTYHHSFFKRIMVGIRYVVTDIWSDLAGWFFVGILLVGVITVLIPDDIITRYMGGGFLSMLLMLVFGIPIYICATASTPIAAALILKGVSPGAALIFLLVGPATNITSLSVLVGILGKRATALYLISISVVSILCALLLDAVYRSLGISARAVIGHASELLPHWLMICGAILLIIISMRPLAAKLKCLFRSKKSVCNSSSCPCDVDHIQNNKRLN